jgi:hypothetical protein
MTQGINTALGYAPTVEKVGHKSVINGLTTVFNVIFLTIAIVVLSLTVVGLPLAFSAASTAIYDWRQGGETRVMRTFWFALRSRPLHRVAVVGPALLAAALGLIEAGYFLHYRGPIDLMCVTIGLVTVAAGVSFTGYLLLLITMAPEAGWAELWRCAAALVGRTSVVATPVFLLEAGVATVIGFADPALLVIAVPVVLLWLWLRTAIWGARRAGLAV